MRLFCAGDEPDVCRRRRRKRAPNADAGFALAAHAWPRRRGGGTCRDAHLLERWDYFRAVKRGRRSGRTGRVIRLVFRALQVKPIQLRYQMHFFDSRQSSGAKMVILRLTVVSCHLATIRRTVDHDGAGPGAVAATRDHPGGGPRRR